MKIVMIEIASNLALITSSGKKTGNEQEIEQTASKWHP